MEKKLSVLMAFKNEGEEVALTCKSIRDTAGDKVDIIVYNDVSSDGYDYKKSLEPYNVKYFEGTQRLGSSLGKNLCVEKCETPYFLILDAHCRLYTKDWLDKALSVLEQEKDCIYCCKVQYFSDETDHMSSKHMCAYGGYLDYNIKSLFSPAWNLHNLTKDVEGNPPFKIPCLLGANYLCSKRWWNKLKGLQGLRLYGREETFISKKSWMAGGEVRCIPTIHTGHKCRIGNRQPYACLAYEVIHNAMVIAYLLLPRKFDVIIDAFHHLYDIGTYTQAINLFNSHKDELDMYKEYYSKLFKYTYEETDAFNKQFQGIVRFDWDKQKEAIKGTYNSFHSKSKDKFIRNIG